MRVKFEPQQYLTTAQAALELGVSMGTVQNLVNAGRLSAVRTQGGHRRIFISSVQDYRKASGYIRVNHTETIGIMPESESFEFEYIPAQSDQKIQIFRHPLELLGFEDEISTLFIDARNAWLASTPPQLIAKLQQRYSVRFFNAKEIPENSHWRQLQGLQLIAENISAAFIAGFCAAKNSMSFEKIMKPI